MLRDLEELNRLARAAADRAVEQFKSKVPITATCPDCEHLISVAYVEPPGDSFVTKCECRRSNRILRGVLGPPEWVLSQRDRYLQKASGAGVLDATFYAMYFNDCEFGGYFDCRIDPRALLPDASEEVVADAMHRSKRLYHGQNAYVGAAFFKHTDEPLTYEDAVEKLRRDNPGFCEDAYDIVIHDNIRGMR
jgi:hypothetical protein